MYKIRQSKGDGTGQNKRQRGESESGKAGIVNERSVAKEQGQ